MGGRGGCRSWEEDIYWNHFQFINFTQFLRNDFHQQLALPKTFSDNIKKKLPEKVTLKGPGGVTWNIGLKTRDDTVYFSDGWQQFVKDHSLKENDFLVCKYNGESLFEVLIFDGESSCEKAASYFVRKCGRANTEPGVDCSSKGRETNNSVEEVNTPSNGGDEVVSPEKTVHLDSIRVPFGVPSETPNGKTSNGGVGSACPEKLMADAVTEPMTAAAPSHSTGKRTRRPVYAITPVSGKKRGRPPKASNSHERALNWVADAEPSPRSSPKGRSGTTELYASNRREISKDEIEITLQLAQAVCTDECLLVTMRPSHVYKRFFVSLPNKWILKHIAPTSQDVILRMGKKEWIGRYCYHNIRNNGGLTGGWRRFALDNNLEEFDICLLKPAGHTLNANNTLIIEISIFRVVEEVTPLTAVRSPAKRKIGVKRKIDDDVAQLESH